MGRRSAAAVLIAIAMVLAVGLQFTKCVWGQWDGQSRVLPDPAAQPPANSPMAVGEMGMFSISPGLAKDFGPGQPAGPSAVDSRTADLAAADDWLTEQGLLTRPRSDTPFWFFDVEALALTRRAQGETMFAGLIVETQEGTETIQELVRVFGTEDLHFDYSGGGRAVIGRTLGDFYAVEAVYFGVRQWDEFAAIRDDTSVVVNVGGTSQTVTGALMSPFSEFGDPPIVGLDYNNLVAVSYEAELQNAEMNLRWRVPLPPCPFQASAIVGGRWISLRERLGYLSESAVPAPSGSVNDIRVGTGNNMLGVQVGGLFEYFIDPDWWIDCEVKGAILSNDADQNTDYTYTSGTGAPTNYVFGRDNDCTTWAVDLSLMAEHQVTRCLSVCLGYQAVWLDGVALASENLNNQIDVLRSGPAVLHDRGNVAFHGPRLGITWIW